MKRIIFFATALVLMLLGTRGTYIKGEELSKKQEEKLVIYPVIPFEGYDEFLNDIYKERKEREANDGYVLLETERGLESGDPVGIVGTDTDADGSLKLEDGYSASTDRSSGEETGYSFGEDGGTPEEDGGIEEGNSGNEVSDGAEGDLDESSYDISSDYAYADVENGFVERGYNLCGLGNWTVTAYCPCDICCGAYSSGYTASGTLATAGRTVACNSLPIGTQVMIDGCVYVVEDTGWSPYGENWIDIFFNSHEEALAFGMQTREVYLVE